MEDKLLFGGAISCSLPNGSVDLSDIRPVPSHQECWFVETAQNASISFTIEILQRQEQIPDERIAEYLFEDLAKANDSPFTSSFQAQAPTALAQIPASVIQRGSGRLLVATATQHISSYTVSAPEKVVVEVCVIRIPEKTAEILLTIMVPLRLPSSDQQAHLWMNEMMASFRILDWGLFA